MERRLAVARERGLDDVLLEGHVVAEMGRERLGQRAGVDGPDAVRVDLRVDLDDRVVREIRDRAVVGRDHDARDVAVGHDRLDHVDHLDALVLVADGQVGERHGIGAGSRPAGGEPLELRDARALVVHVVGRDAVAHRRRPGGAGVGRLETLHLREELGPVLPAVRQHAVGLERPPDDRPRRILEHQGHGVRAVGQPQRLDRRAVVDAGDDRRHRDLLGLDARLPRQPLGGCWRGRRTSTARRLDARARPCASRAPRSARGSCS